MSAGTLPAELLHAARAPYRIAGRFAYQFARGKLAGDPAYRAILEHGLLQGRRQVLDLGCGLGLLAAVLRAAERCAEDGCWPDGWPAAPRALSIRGIELMPRTVERARRAPFEVIGCETGADVELGGHRFIGYIDRLDRDDATGTVTVVDYKTGSIATSAQEYLAEVRAFREFQLPFYYWARTAEGDVVTRLALIPLKDALLDVAPVELEVVTTSRPPRGNGAVGEIGVSELERARERMIALAGELACGSLTTFPATTDPEACRYCAYALACRERPLALEERFAR